KLETILYFATVFSITVQLGKHFWPPYSIIHGLRVDYLSPTLHVSDILIFALFCVTVVNRPAFLTSYGHKLLKSGFIIAPFALIVSTLFAYSPLVSLFALLKLAEM